jgi:hypothetical protein
MVAEWVVYEIAPIDLWLGALTVAEVVKDLSQYGKPGEEKGAELNDEAEYVFRAFLNPILQDTELRQGPYIVTLPLSSQWSRAGYAYKLHNKGITYIVIKGEYEKTFDEWFLVNKEAVTKKCASELQMLTP